MIDLIVPYGALLLLLASNVMMRVEARALRRRADAKHEELMAVYPRLTAAYNEQTRLANELVDVSRKYRALLEPKGG